jgi:hypothetical protein
MTDDDIDPVAEVRAVRAKIWRKYKTMDAYFDHLKDVPSVDVLLAQIRKKLEKAKDKVKPNRPAASRAGKRPASRRRKAAVHA